MSTGAILRLAAALLLVVAAPTIGDIGSCGEPPEDLDPVKFFRAKADLECQRCVACDLSTAACVRACDPRSDAVAFEAGCYPLVHDGAVCLSAIESVGCGAFEAFVADQGATAPTECLFCPPEAR